MTTPNRTTSYQVTSSVIGLAVGDALGVPVEFLSRQYLDSDPVTDMRGNGTHRQPAGTWSDDTSLTLCLLHSLCKGHDWHDQARKFRQWKMDDLWTPHGQVFDIGATTSRAIANYSAVTDPRLAGPTDQYSNGNGSLMRILPIGLYYAETDVQTRIEIAMQASCLTHGHIRSQLACGFYVQMIALLVQGIERFEAVHQTQLLFTSIIENQYPQERLAFERPLNLNLADQARNEIPSSGYVIDTLTASIWCFLNANSYDDAVLTAVNLGGDTDTTGAVTGGLAGLYFGLDNIPKDWLTKLVKVDQIQTLCSQFTNAILSNENHPKRADNNA